MDLCNSHCVLNLNQNLCFTTLFHLLWRKGKKKRLFVKLSGQKVMWDLGSQSSWTINSWYRVESCQQEKVNHLRQNGAGNSSHISGLDQGRAPYRVRARQANGFSVEDSSVTQKNLAGPNNFQCSKVAWKCYDFFCF